LFFVIALVLIPLVLGFVANMVVGRNQHFENWELFVAGFIGAFVGGFLVNLLRSVDMLQLSIWSVIGLFVGAIIVLAVWGWLRAKVLKSKMPG